MSEDHTSLISEEMRAHIGAQLEWRVSWPVSMSDIRRWAIAVYYPAEPPVNFMNEADVIAPQEFNPFAWAVQHSSSGPQDKRSSLIDNIERDLGITPPPVTHRLNGGSSVIYGTPVRPGDVITATSFLRGYRERDGRLGTMLITEIESIWTNQCGAEVRRGIDTSIRY